MEAKTIRTALDAVVALKMASGLTYRQRNDGISAIRTVVCQLERYGIASDAVLATFYLNDLAGLDAKLKTLPATAIGMSPRSLAQTVSRFRRALRAVGVPIADGRGHRPLSTAWAEFLSAITAAERTILLPLGLWMNDHYVEPRP